MADPTITVTLIACVAGNPLAGEKPTIDARGATTWEPADDVWEPKEYTFPNLDAAKAWIATLHPDMTTHVTVYADDRVIWEQDRAEDLDDARILTDDEHQAREDAIAGVVMVPDFGVGPAPAPPPPAPPAFTPPKGA